MMKFTILQSLQNLNFFCKICLLTLFLTSCFENVDSNNRADASKSSGPVSEITDNDFAGAYQASNIVTGIEVKWNASLKPVQSYRVYRVKGSLLELIASVGSLQNSVIDGSVTWGAIYSYIVKAVDSKGIEDPNTNRISALSWGGLSTVEAETSQSIRVGFDNSSAIANEIRIYIKPNDASSEKVLVGSVSPSAGGFLIENLRPGFSYLVSAQAYVSSLGKEDGNNTTWNINTKTLGFHDNGLEPAKWRNAISVRAFGESPGAPTHPTIPDKSPKVRTVEISFLPFLALSAQQKYVVIRAPEGQNIDTSAVEACTESTNRSCRPCGVVTQALSTVFCRDTNVAPSPARYRYTMAIQHTEGVIEWVEPLPAESIENFSVLVPIPPQDMVLAQRDSINYEMCVVQMNKSSDPRNKNRCEYNGAGSVPYNSGIGKQALNLNPNYYDFGYSYFIPRYPLGCNWTSAANGGMCGPGGTPGDCVGNVATASFWTKPSNTLGVDGNIFWTINNRSDLLGEHSACAVKTNGVWRWTGELDRILNSENLIRSAFTFDPSTNNGKTPVTTYYTSFNNSQDICQSFNDPNYGRMRIPRMREFRTFFAFPTVPGEPYSTNYNAAMTIRNGARWNATDGFRCSSNVHHMNTAVAPDMYASSLNDLLTNPDKEVSAYVDSGNGYLYGRREFFIGKTGNSDCVSRFGQYLMHVDTTFSDAFYYNSATLKYTGQQSPLDSGNKDVLTDVNGGLSGYVLDAGGSSAIAGTAPNQYHQIHTYNNSSANANFMNLALGLPAYTNSSTQYLPRTNFIENYDSYLIYTFLSAGDSTMYVRSRSFDRWGSQLINTTSLTSSTYGNLTCILPAE